jgi:putative flippase GtrA
VSRSSLSTLFRSGVGGVTGSVFDFTAMVVLVELAALAYAPAAAVAALAGAVVCFALNRYWAFGDRTPLRLRQVGQFAIVAAGSAAMNAGVVHVLAGTLRVAYLLAKAVSAGLVFVTWTYPAQSKLVFAQRS